MNETLRERPRGLTANGLRLWGMLCVCAGMAGRGLLQNAMLGLNGLNSAQLLKLLETNPDGFDCLTWVPVSRLRKLRRGYDQVELLARAISAELELPAEALLIKHRDNRANSGLRTPEERRANVLGVYRAAAPDRIAGKRVLLLDDIVTTGATASECARVLLTAGAEEVIFAAVAAATSSK